MIGKVLYYSLDVPTFSKPFLRLFSNQTNRCQRVCCRILHGHNIKTILNRVLVFGKMGEISDFINSYLKQSNKILNLVFRRFVSISFTETSKNYNLHSFRSPKVDFFFLSHG